MDSLSEDDRAELINRYLGRYTKFGVDVRTLNVGDPEKYARQHAIHAAVGPLNGMTVLDIGCGFSLFYEYLKHKDISVRYIGYDVIEPFVIKNRENYPEATFRVIDISKDRIVDSCDYVIMCQVFNNLYKDADNVEVVKSAIAKAFDVATRAVSVDMLSTYVNYTEPKLFYFSPEEMFSFAKTLTPYVGLQHAYLEHHFTIQLHKSRIVL